MAIYVPNVPTFVLGFYGAVNAGAVPIPLNLRFEQGEVEYVIAHVEHVYLAGDAALDIPETNVYDFETSVGNASGDFESVPREMDDHCFFMHTSGTTGRAKPVIATHGNIYAHDKAYIHHIGFTTDDVALTAVPLFHNSGLNLKLTTFTLLGAPQVLLKEWDPEEALQAIEDHGVTYLFTIPTMLYDLVNRDPADSEDAYDAASLQYAPTDGQNVPVDPRSTLSSPM